MARLHNSEYVLLQDIARETGKSLERVCEDAVMLADVNKGASDNPPPPFAIEDPNVTKLRERYKGELSDIDKETADRSLIESKHNPLQLYRKANPIRQSSHGVTEIHGVIVFSGRDWEPFPDLFVHKEIADKLKNMLMPTQKRLSDKEEKIIEAIRARHPSVPSGLFSIIALILFYQDKYVAGDELEVLIKELTSVLQGGKKPINLKMMGEVFFEDQKEVKPLYHDVNETAQIAGEGFVRLLCSRLTGATNKRSRFDTYDRSDLKAQPESHVVIKEGSALDEFLELYCAFSKTLNCIENLEVSNHQACDPDSDQIFSCYDPKTRSTKTFAQLLIDLEGKLQNKGFTTKFAEAIGAFVKRLRQKI